MHLVINQSTDRTEQVTTACIDKLYNLSKSNTLDGTSYLRGSINATAAYEDAVTFLNTTWGPDLIVTASDYYIRFADPEVESVLKTALNKAEGEGITTLEAANTVANYFQNNTDIESFDELKYFKTGSYNFDGCTNLESVDITDKQAYFTNCTNLVNWYGGRKPNGYLYLGDKYIKAEGCPNLTELEIGEESSNLANNQFANSSNINILRCKPSLGYQFGYPAFRAAPVKNIYMENMDNWLTCRTYGSSMIDSTTKIFYNNQLITSVEIPQTITQIGAANGGCFAEYSYLTSVQFHSGITSIAQGTFNNCTNLVIQDLNLPNLTTLGSYAFQGTKVQTISDLGSVTNIPEYCFKGCSQLTTIDQGILDNITVLNKEAFNNCTNLGYAKQSDNTISSVLRLPNLTSIALDSVRYTKFTEITDLGNITTVRGFSEMTNLTSVALPQTCTTIGDSAFVNDNALTTINLNNVTSIGTSAFSNCENLMYFHGAGSVAGELDLSNVTSIGKGAFNNCKSLTSYTLGNITELPDYVFSGCDALTSIVIPNTVTKIGTSAFGNILKTLHQNLVIPSSVTSIGWGAFNATTFDSVTIMATVPPTLGNSNAFNNNGQFPIYVPSGSVDAYKSASIWNSLASRIQAIPNS